MEMEPSTLHIDLGDSAQPAGTAGAAGTAGTARKAGTAGKAGPAEQAGPSGPTGQQGRRGWRGLLRQSPIGPLASPSLGRLSCQRIPSAYILQLPMKTIVELLLACEMAGGRRRGALSVVSEGNTTH